jgi:hypothetical protein
MSVSIGNGSVPLIIPIMISRSEHPVGTFPLGIFVPISHGNCATSGFKGTIGSCEGPLRIWATVWHLGAVHAAATSPNQDEDPRAPAKARKIWDFMTAVCQEKVFYLKTKSRKPELTTALKSYTLIQTYYQHHRESAFSYAPGRVYIAVCNQLFGSEIQIEAEAEDWILMPQILLRVILRTPYSLNSGDLSNHVIICIDLWTRRVDSRPNFSKFR